MVHVPPEVLPHAPMSPLYKMPNLREIGSRILKDAMERCHELAPDLYIEGAIGSGHRVSCILEESRGAAAVVLGTREWHPYRVFGGSVTVGVAARAHSPVIAVPPSWRERPATGKVVVGVDEMGGPAPVLAHAFEAARIRKAELTIVHAWTPPHPYGPVLGSFDAGQWERFMEQWLGEVTAGARADNPDVVTHLVGSFGIERVSVAELARDGDLLVLGRQRYDSPFLHRLGSVAQHAVHAGTCPVEIVPVHQGGLHGRGTAGE